MVEKRIGPANVGGKCNPDSSRKIYSFLNQDPGGENDLSLSRQMGEIKVTCRAPVSHARAKRCKVGAEK